MRQNEKFSAGGGSRIFSRQWGGGLGFSKKVSKIVSTFFLGRSNLFLDLSQSTTKTVLANNSASQAKFDCPFFHIE